MTCTRRHVREETLRLTFSSRIIYSRNFPKYRYLLYYIYIYIRIHSAYARIIQRKGLKDLAWTAKARGNFVRRSHTSGFRSPCSRRLENRVAERFCETRSGRKHRKRSMVPPPHNECIIRMSGCV